MRIYLGGPINGCSDSEAKDWRAKVKAAFLAKPIHGRPVEFIDPMDRDYRGRENENAHAIVESDKADIDRCGIMFMNCPRPSVGTSMEVFYGWLTGRHVIVVAPSPVSPWLRYHANELYETIDEAIAALDDFK